MLHTVPLVPLNFEFHIHSAMCNDWIFCNVSWNYIFVCRKPLSIWDWPCEKVKRSFIISHSLRYLVENNANCSFEWYHNLWMKKLEPPVGSPMGGSSFFIHKLWYHSKEQFALFSITINDMRIFKKLLEISCFFPMYKNRNTLILCSVCLNAENFLLECL